MICPAIWDSEIFAAPRERLATASEHAPIRYKSRYSMK